MKEVILLTRSAIAEDAGIFDAKQVAEQTRPAFKAIIILPLAVLILVLLIHLLIPNQQSFTTTKYYPVLLKIFLAVYFVLLLFSFKYPVVKDTLTEKAPLLAAAIIILEIWDLLTLKYQLLPLPYFPGPDKVLNALVGDSGLLAISTLYSLRLLFTGYILGVLAGLATGILIGWNKKWNYWVSPLIKIIGPIPATAWIPIALTIFPTSFWASVYLIALAVWFPVTVMTSSGIENVRNAYFEVARTLGADERYLVFKVAVPAASQMIFVGLFMGMGTSFLTLIVSEMLGVKAGLGWYITWAQGWAEYSKVYASLVVIAIMFSSIITLLFRAKDRVLVWQKGLIKW